ILSWGFRLRAFRRERREEDAQIRNSGKVVDVLCGRTDPLEIKQRLKVCCARVQTSLNSHEKLLSRVQLMPIVNDQRNKLDGNAESQEARGHNKRHQGELAEKGNIHHFLRTAQP